MSFNSIKVRLIHSSFDLSGNINFSFNSIKVRLIQPLQKTKEEARTRFNSIKVRLILGSNLSSVLESRFQFHKGSINTKQAAFGAGLNLAFQFHKGSINTLLLSIVISANFVSIP